MLKSKRISIKAMAERDQGYELGMNRREMLRFLIASIGFAALPHVNGAEEAKSGAGRSQVHSNDRNPPWYGFNLLEYFSTDPDWMKYFPYRNHGAFREDDFRWMRDWGFNFARLPMDYRFWTDPGDPRKIDERKLEPIDRAIRLGERNGIHIDLCLHRAPGFCILDSLDPVVTGIHITKEKRNLFTDSDARDAFVQQWTVFAQRYRSIPSDRLSFNLVNEPKVSSTSRQAGARKGDRKDDSPEKSELNAKVPGAREYVQIAQTTIGCIHNTDPSRLIVVDGFEVATEPVWELASVRAIQSAHYYYPETITFYRAEWARGQESFTGVPTWPFADGRSKPANGRDNVDARFQPRRKLAASNVAIHFGEMVFISTLLRRPCWRGLTTRLM